VPGHRPRGVFVVRDVAVEQVVITEGRLFATMVHELPEV
jgi:hypothetical protein